MFVDISQGSGEHQAQHTYQMVQAYSAWLHEMRHMRDDRDTGWSGMSIIADPDRRYEWEVRAYNVEIELALKADRSDIADKLRENLEKERRKIYGEQFN